MKSFFRALAALAFLVAFAAPAQAVVITYSFGGSLTSVLSPLGSAFTVGDSFFGSVSVDTNGPVDSVGGNFKDYDAVTGFSMTVAGLTYTGDGGNVRVGNSSDGDFLEMDIANLLSTPTLLGSQGNLAGPAVGGLSPLQVTLAFGGGSGLWDVDFSIPTNVMLGDFSDNSMFFDFIDTNSRNITVMSGEFERFGPAAVPLPGTALLMAPFLLGLTGGFGRRRKV